MKKMLVITVFMLATLAWAAAQQPGNTPDRSSGQAAPPSSQAPDASQSQPSTPGSADQGTAPESQGHAVNAPVTEGCLGGTAPNFTITDKAGTTYKLNIPPNANASSLSQHVGESVQVAGNVNRTGNGSIDVQAIGRGTSKCPGSGLNGATPPPK